MKNETDKTLPKTEPRKPLPPLLVAVGTVVSEYKRCGKPNCRCASGEPGTLHGPYFYRYFRIGRRLVKRYVPREQAPELRARCDAQRQIRRECRQSALAVRAELARFRAALRELEKEFRP